jgi:hypothetical protein
MALATLLKTLRIAVNPWQKGNVTRSLVLTGLATAIAANLLLLWNVVSEVPP